MIQAWEVPIMLFYPQISPDGKFLPKEVRVKSCPAGIACQWEKVNEEHTQEVIELFFIFHLAI